MDPRQAPKQRHHHPFDGHRDVPAWAHTLNDNLQLIWWVLELALENQMKTKEEILAEIRGNTNIVVSSRQAMSVLLEGQATIEARIQSLKDQIAAGQTEPDLSELDTALDDQRAAIESLRSDISANTPEGQAAAKDVTATAEAAQANKIARNEKRGIPEPEGDVDDRERAQREADKLNAARLGAMELPTEQSPGDANTPPNQENPAPQPQPE